MGEQGHLEDHLPPLSNTQATLGFIPDKFSLGKQKTYTQTLYGLSSY